MIPEKDVSGLYIYSGGFLSCPKEIKLFATLSPTLFFFFFFFVCVCFSSNGFFNP
jgi:hypothetical protein